MATCITKPKLGSGRVGVGWGVDERASHSEVLCHFVLLEITLAIFTM